MFNEKPEVAHKNETKIPLNLRQDLVDLFHNASDPIAVLLQTTETKEFKNKIDEKLSAEVKSKLQALKFSNAEDFATQILAVAEPILEIIYNGKKISKQNRELYSEADLNASAELIIKSNAKKVYVVGNVGSGKTTFSRELSQLIDYKNIDLDLWFAIFRQQEKREATNIKELLQYILKKEQPPFLINHSDLLRQDLIKDADAVIYLNPKIEELLKTRQTRTENQAEGEWQSVSPEDYDKSIRDNSDRFSKLGGKIAYQNTKTGTYICLLTKK